MKTYFSVDAKTILTLGRDSIKDHTTAVLELVKNSYDADAKNVMVEIYCNKENKLIRITDNGIGMEPSDIEKYWLRIGYSEKRTNKYSALKRRKTGEKGIGRISADRLGAHLLLKTKSKNNKLIGLGINWEDFNVEEKNIGEIKIDWLEEPNIIMPIMNDKDFVSGTELIITNLRQNWQEEEIYNLYNELSLLTPPFRKVKDFEIKLKTDVINNYSTIIKSPFLEVAELEFNGNLKRKTLEYQINERANNSKRKNVLGKISLDKLIQSTTEEKTDTTKSLGNIELKLLFYPRESRILEGTKFRLSDLRDFLDTNAGVKIYRDNIRVKPYGDPNDPEGDWLSLAERKTREPAGVARPTYRIASNQLVGAVFISRDKNPKLVDSSSREGLIEGEAFNELRKAVMGCLILLESHRHKRYLETKSIVKEIISPIEEVKLLNRALDILGEDLQKVRGVIPQTSSKPLNRTIDQITEVNKKIQSTRPVIQDLVSQTRITRGLATIGIAASVFAHETQSAISEFISSAETSVSAINRKQPNYKIALEEVTKAKKYARRVAAWGTYALARIQRDKRKRKLVNIKKIIENIITELSPIFNASNIDIRKSELQDVLAKTFAMDIEAIIVNLLTNAYTATRQINNLRRISVKLKREAIQKTLGYSIIVSDNGRGVPKKFHDRIWDPLFTTKVDREGKEIGTGLGLTIVTSIVEDLRGKKMLSKDKKLGGAQFKIWFPIK